MNQRKAGTILSYLHIFLNNTISIIYTPYMLRLMGQSEYGLFGTANSFISYLSLLSFGIAGAYIRFNIRCRAAGDREEEKRLNGMFLTVFSVLASFVLVGGLLCTALAGELVKDTFTNDELMKLRIIMLLLTINMVISFLFNVVMMALQAYEKYIVLRSVSLVTGIITPLVNVIALRAGGRAVSLSVLSLVISILTYLFYLFYARKSIKLEVSFKGFRKDVLREIFVFSGFLFLNSITDQITFSTDSVILSAVYGTSVVAVYTVGANFKNYFQQFSSSVSGVFAPTVNLMVAHRQGSDALTEVFTRIGRIQFYIVSLVLIGYVSIGQDFVRIWAGEDYTDAFYIGLLLILAVFVPAFQNIGLEIQKAMNMHKARSVVYFLIALLNIILTIPFSQWWGGIGAALATTLCWFFGSVVWMNWYYHRRIGLDMLAFWKSIASMLPGYLPACLVGFLINRFWSIQSLMEILLAAAVISCTFAVSAFFMSMNAYEKSLVTAPFKKILKR